MLICILFNAHDMRDRQLMLVEKYAIISECMYMLSSSMYATISLFLLSFCFFYIHFILLIKRDETQRTVRNNKKKQQPTIEAVCSFHDNDDYNDVGNKPIFLMFAFVSYLRDMHRKTFKCIRSHFFLLFPSLSSAPPLDTVPHIHYTLCDCCFFLSVSCLISRCLFVAIASVLGFCTDTHSI